MMRIGEVSKMFDMSNRTLRYWGEKGILESNRMDNGYRYYTDHSIMSDYCIMKVKNLKMLWN